MKKTDLTILSLLTLLLITVVSCDDTITGTEIDKIQIPGRNVSYQEYIEPVLQIKCANNGCHDAISGAGGIVLVTHAHTTRDVSIVFPYNPDNSRLVWAIEGQTGTIMPPLGYYPLTANQVEGIKTWISEGAQNN
ncbi:MAG: hypothetical protein KKA84_11810 [Bacteroidetes bacterium]|nr:hypothetical protein [Bacteroidota bacterium]